MTSIPENASQAPTGNNTSTTGAQQGQGQGEDYLDKGLDAAEKKWGGSAGQDTEKNRGVNEKIVRLCIQPPPTIYSPSCYCCCYPFFLKKMLNTNDYDRRMAPVTCLKKQPAKTYPTNSQTKLRAQTLPELGTRVPAAETGKRGGGLKQKWSKLDDKWNKCRPYVERINGTIVPLRSREDEFEERIAGVERSRTV